MSPRILDLPEPADDPTQMDLGGAETEAQIEDRSLLHHRPDLIQEHLFGSQSVRGGAWQDDRGRFGMVAVEMNDLDHPRLHRQRIRVSDYHRPCLESGLLSSELDRVVVVRSENPLGWPLNQLHQPRICPNWPTADDLGAGTAGVFVAEPLFV